MTFALETMYHSRIRKYVSDCIPGATVHALIRNYDTRFFMYMYIHNRVKSGNFGHPVNSGICLYLQTVEFSLFAPLIYFLFH